MKENFHLYFWGLHCLLDPEELFCRQEAVHPRVFFNSTKLSKRCDSNQNVVAHQRSTRIPLKMFRQQFYRLSLWSKLKLEGLFIFLFSYPTSVCNFGTVGASTYHAAGDDRLQVVEGWGVALLSVDDSHVGVHQHVRHFFGHVLCCSPSRHQAGRTTSRVLDSVSQLQGPHCFGLFYWLLKLEKKKKNRSKYYDLNSWSKYRRKMWSAFR